MTEHERDGNGSSYLFLAGRVGVRPSRKTPGRKNTYASQKQLSSGSVAA